VKKECKCETIHEAGFRLNTTGTQAQQPPRETS
jgi:hypothetical protein